MKYFTTKNDPLVAAASSVLSEDVESTVKARGFTKQPNGNYKHKSGHVIKIHPNGNFTHQVPGEAYHVYNKSVITDILDNYHLKEEVELDESVIEEADQRYTIIKGDYKGETVTIKAEFRDGTCNVNVLSLKAKGLNGVVRGIEKKNLKPLKEDLDESTELDEGIVDFKGASKEEITAIIDKLKSAGHRPEWEDTTRLSTKNSSTQAALKKALKNFMKTKSESVTEAALPVPETPVELLRKGSKTGFRAGVTDRIFAATFRQLGEDEEIARRAVDSFLNAIARLEPSKKLIEGIAKAFD